jgi:plastocyanin
VGRVLRTGIVIICALVLVLPAAARRADTPTLTAIVGTNDGFTITLNDASGKKVSRIAPGTYTVLVEDRSALHNFHLASNEDPTVDFRTELEFVGEKSFTVTFRDNTRYAYACEPHWQVMNGEFFVTNTPAPPPPPPPAPVRKLSVIVKPGGAVVLSRASVSAGRYRLTVDDHGKRDNFHLRGKTVNKRTGLAFRGRVGWGVTLARGTYSYGSDRTGLTRKLRVR